MDKKIKNLEFYRDMKKRNKCTSCGKPLTKEDEYSTCFKCYIKKRFSVLESRMRKIEKYLNMMLKSQEEERIH